jgi:UDP-N-acetylglucosamine:LPS N-acetylglucosamine transferase
MAKKRITFAMIEAGGGHKMPALAVYESLNRLYPGKYDMKVLDFMKDLGCVDLDQVHKRMWKYLLTRPSLTKAFQTFDFITGPVNIQVYKLAGTAFHPYVLRYLRKEKPDLMFSTHYFNTMSVAHVRKTYGVNTILVNFLSEVFDFDSYWYLKNVDHYIVTSQEAERKLLRRRFPRGKLHVFPYPVRRSFFRIRAGRQETLGGLGLDPSRRTLLVTLGSEGIGTVSIARLLTALVRRDLPLNVIVVAGKNGRLKRQLEVEFGDSRGATTVLPLGFCSNMNELINASDFCFIKPGPATTWEVLSLRKPILFAASAQLSENPNIRYAVRNRVGTYVGMSPQRFVRRVRELMENSALQQVQQQYDRLALKNGADDIARFVNAVLSGGLLPTLPPSSPARRARRHPALRLSPIRPAARHGRRAGPGRPARRSPTA